MTSTTKAQTPAEEPAETQSAMTDEQAERYAQALHLVRRASAWGFGAGCIPLPIIDMATVTGVQLKMIGNLSKLYGIPFREHTVKNIIAGLLGSIVPYGLTWGALGSAIKAIPGIGGPLALLTMPGFSSATTWALGRIFIQHFEAGGTMLDFDVDKMRGYFKAEYEAKKAENESKPAASKAAN